MTEDEGGMLGKKEDGAFHRRLGNGSMSHQELLLTSVHLDNVGEDVIRLCQERNHTV